MNITRNRQQVTFSTDHADGDIVQTSDFLNSADLPIPVKDFLISGVHVVASTGPLARQAIRERNAQLDAPVVDEMAAAPLAPLPAAPKYTPPATHHPRRCYCGRFAGGHIPGLLAPIASDPACVGDAVKPHDPETCGACLAGATDGPPPASARRADTGYGTYAVLSAQYHRNGSSGLGFFVGFVRGLDGEGAGRVLQVTTLLSRDSEATEYDAIPVFVTDPTDPTQKFRGDNFVGVAWAVVDTVDDQWNARMAELAARNANR
jgi:hypothetical protein